MIPLTHRPRPAGQETVGRRLRPMPFSDEPRNPWPCPDCGAEPDAPCDDTCPSAAALEQEQALADEDAYEPPCCPPGAMCACRIGEPA